MSIEAQPPLGVAVGGGVGDEAQPPLGVAVGGGAHYPFANEAVVGAEAIGQQSNSGNGMTDMPLASAVMMLLSLYYALKW